MGLSNKEESRQTQVKGDIVAIATLEKTFWRQKSRALYVKEGDNNTRFFHRLANSYRKANHIRSIEVDGVFYKDGSSVQAQVVQFYQNLYTETDMWRPTVDGLDFACIGEDERMSLKREFSKEEVTQVLMEMGGDKAPGPDGFTMAFFSKMLECGGGGCHGCF